MQAMFDFGDQVRVIKNIRNDGTFMGSTRGALLIRRGSVGYIKGVGKFLQDQVIYEVDFIEQGASVGCRESELIDVNMPWVERLFERGDRVTVLQSLSSCGKIVVASGASGQVLGIECKKAPLSYRILFEQQNSLNNNSWIVPESALKIEQTAAPLLSGMQLGRK